MFSANITGRVKRVLHDNEKDGKDAMLKVVIEARKQYVKDGDMPNVYPVVAVFGHDAAYIRDYAGKGHWVHFYNCDMDVYRPDDAEEDRVSFKAGRIELLPKDMSQAIEETIDEDEEEEKPRRKKRGSRSGSAKGGAPKRGKSRSERRRRRDEEEDYDDEDFEDDEEEEEEEKPRRRKKPAAKKPARKKAPAKKKAPVDEDDYDDDYDDDDYDDDDDYFED